jgi:excinuclease ABC subunit C
VMRGAKRKGTRYFGPYAHAWAIRETVDLLLRVFPVRTCSNGVFKRAGQIGRPCLLGYIDKCSAPCVGRVSEEDHRALAEDFCDFMAGDTAKFTRRLEREMRQASDELEFERAARLRDDVQALKRAMEKSAVVLPDGTDADVFALAEDELEAAVQVFHVRGGRIRGQRGWVVEKVEEVTTGDLVERLLLQVYGDADAVPREVLVPADPTDAPEVETLLSELRGSRVQVRVPQRGDKRALLETVARNAGQALTLHKTRRAGDLTTRSQALNELQEALGLPEAPLRIECYDISTIQGEHTVGSMVVFEDGLARKSEYRKFTVRGRASDGATDDLSALHEVLTRRFRRYLADQEQARDPELGAGTGPQDLDPSAPDGGDDALVPDGVARDDALLPGAGDPDDGPVVGEKRRFAYPPNLVVVDGGAPQVAAAARAMADLGIDGIGLCGLAKRLEEVWLPGEDQPLVLPRTSEGLYLLQRVRDEAHRFAITHHRKRRSTAMTVSVLDEVPGLGPARKKALLAHFGSLKKLRAAEVAEIAAVQGVGPKVAQAVAAALGAAEPAVAVNVTTGEIIE